MKILLCFCLFTITNGELFTSIRHIAMLLKNEKNLISGLEKYYEAEVEKLDWMKENYDNMEELIKDYEEIEDSKIPVFEELNLNHPIDAFRLFQRYHNLWIDAQKKASSTENMQLINAELTIKELPDKKDFDGACLSVLRIQRTYKISTEDLVRGQILGVKSDPLSKKECEEIASVAESSTLFKDYATSWRLAALNKTDESDTPGLIDAYFGMANAHLALDDAERAEEYVEKIFDLDAENETLYGEILEYHKKIDSIRGQPIWQRNVTTEFERYEALCRNDFPPKPLFCRYRKGKIPYELIKEEILSSDPLISLVYNVISEQEADKIVDLAYPSMARAQMIGGWSGDNRISKVGWLDDTKDKMVSKIAKRINRLIHLKTTSVSGVMTAEPFQVVTYGIGGQYEPHKDYFDAGNSAASFGQSGNRIATFIFYLSSISHGGATVFPEVNVTVNPVKGAAALWYNMKRSGEGDSRTLHAGCPVVLGQKWVANKWIHEYGQEWERPCGLATDAKDLDLYK